MQKITATVSGSFHRFMPQIYDVVGMLLEAGVRVLSPADPRVVEEIDDFLFVESDRTRSIRLVQERHLRCIEASTFLWLVSPDGYVGSSAAMEIGFAAAAGTPVFCDTEPNDTKLRQYVRTVAAFDHSLLNLLKPRETQGISNFLVNPADSVAELHRTLENVLYALTNRDRSVAEKAETVLGNAQIQFAQSFTMSRL